MTEGNFPGNFLTPLKRYVPLVAWAAVLLAVLFIPLRITQYGYLPGDDALRHAAKAVSSKGWPEILVLNGSYNIDHEFGWNLLLRKLYLCTHWNADQLVVFSVVALFALAAWPVMACMKRPEAWLATLALVALVSVFVPRLLLGRPFNLTVVALMVILLRCQHLCAVPPRWKDFFWMASLVAAAVYFHGVWYLWVLPGAAFFLAQQFRWGLVFSFSWAAGTLAGATLTGHPWLYLSQALHVAFHAMGMHLTQSTLVSELRPSGGEVLMVALFGGLLAFRQLANLHTPPLHRSPALWLVVLGWVMGLQTDRFWEDWGVPALMVLIAWELQAFFLVHFAVDSFKRLALVGGLAITVLAVTTNDQNSRWSASVKTQYLSVAEHPELAGWMPDKGGIFYSADMTLFYQTFFKNPDGDWRYIVGFESTFMPDEDFKVYHSIHWNNGDHKAFEPWVKKMRPQDRLVVRGDSGGHPAIEGLDWFYGVSGIWIGRLPATNGIPSTH